MATDPLPSPSGATVPPSLELALEQSHEVKAKVEAAADELAAANAGVKRQIDGGTTTVPAAQALHVGRRVEAQVQECADDLHEVTDTLAQGVADLQQVELSLARTRLALADTERALAQAQADEHQATLRAMHDAATGLPNRGLFDDRLEHGIALAERHDWTLAVMFLDLDRFKSINDLHGHAAGDGVLKEVARRLSAVARDEDTICRNGGDEFLYLLVNPKGTRNVQRMAAAVLENIAQPIVVDGIELVIRASIGIALHPADASSGEQLVRHADAAMYRAKQQGCGQALYADVSQAG